MNSVGVDPQRVPITFDQWGNVGPASIAMTLSDESKRLNGGDKVVALGELPPDNVMTPGIFVQRVVEC